MSKYYVSGYMPPDGIQSGEDVVVLQRKLNAMGANLTVDGVYGPRTQAALLRTQGADNPASQWTNGVSSFMQGIQPLFSSSYVSYTPQSPAAIRAQLREALRPGVDAAIDERKEQTHQNMAELDADAWSRGMGRSTYLTDMKDRQMDEQAEDILEMEAAYSAALAQAFLNAQENERERAMQAQLYNANQQADINKLAFSAAQSAYADSLAQAQAVNASRRANSGGATPSQDVAMLFLSLLSPEERAAVYDGVTEKDRAYRDELIRSLGKSGYLQAQGMYPGA